MGQWQSVFQKPKSCLVCPSSIPPLAALSPCPHAAQCGWRAGSKELTGIEVCVCVCACLSGGSICVPCLSLSVLPPPTRLFVFPPCCIQRLACVFNDVTTALAYTHPPV